MDENYIAAEWVYWIDATDSHYKWEYFNFIKCLEQTIKLKCVRRCKLTGMLTVGWRTKVIFSGIFICICCNACVVQQLLRIHYALVIKSFSSHEFETFQAGYVHCKQIITVKRLLNTLLKLNSSPNAINFKHLDSAYTQLIHNFIKFLYILFQNKLIIKLRLWKCTLLSHIYIHNTIIIYIHFMSGAKIWFFAW